MYPGAAGGVGAAGNPFLAQLSQLQPALAAALASQAAQQQFVVASSQAQANSINAALNAQHHQGAYLDYASLAAANQANAAAAGLVPQGEHGHRGALPKT